MPHAIPQTYAVFYPYRLLTGYRLALSLTIKHFTEPAMPNSLTKWIICTKTAWKILFQIRCRGVDRFALGGAGMAQW